MLLFSCSVLQHLLAQYEQGAVKHGKCSTEAADCSTAAGATLHDTAARFKHPVCTCCCAQGFIRVQRNCTKSSKAPYGPFVMLGEKPIMPVLTE